MTNRNTDDTTAAEHRAPVRVHDILEVTYRTRASGKIAVTRHKVTVTWIEDRGESWYCGFSRCAGEVGIGSFGAWSIRKTAEPTVTGALFGLVAYRPIGHG